jgi:hypothetical protein
MTAETIDCLKGAIAPFAISLAKGAKKSAAALAILSLSAHS